MQRRIRFNDFFDRPSAILFIIPGKYAKYWIGLVFIFMVGMLFLHPIAAPFGHLPYVFYWLCLPVAMITHAVLIGSDEWKFIPKFHKPREFVVVQPKAIETRSQMKPKIGSILVGPKNNKRTVYPCVDLTDLVCPIQINMQGYSAGGYLVENNKRTQVVFAYEFQGFPSTISPSQAVNIAEKIESGFRDYKGFEKMTLQYGSFSNCIDGADYLETLSKRATSEEAEFLLHWRKRRMQNLTKLKRHCPKTLRLYFSYTIDSPVENTGEKRIEKVMTKVSQYFQPLKREPITNRLEKILADSFQYGFLSQQRFFKKIGFSVTPMTWEESWGAAWSRINESPVPLPHLVIELNENGLKYEWLSDSPIPVTSQLFKAGAPTLKKDTVYLPGRSKWVGGVVLNQRPNLEWSTTERLEQLEYACEALLSEETHDTELIIQFTSADQNQALRRAVSQTKDSNLSSNIAASHSRIDKGAELNLEQSEDAEESLRRGGTLVKTAWVANIYRDTQSDLNRAISNFTGESAFNGDIVSREMGYYDSLWIETLPFTWRALLQGDIISTTRFERRITETTEATVAFMPVLCDRSKHTEGITFISKDSRTPLYFNPFASNPHGHLLVSGFTGSGKTQLFQCCAEYAFCTGRKVYFFDADKGTGAGALKDFTSFVGGSYFKASDENSNLFEGVDWRTLGEEKETIARDAFKSFLINGLRDLALPQDIGSELSRTSKDVLSLLLDSFLIDPVIQERYQLAWDGGLGSHDWGNIPCLPDFLEFSTLERLPSEMQVEEIKAVLNRLKGSLRALITRKAGRAISLPSTFDRSNRFMVFSLGATGDDDDNLPLILSAQGTMLFGALSSDQTLIAQDEASRLFPKYESIANNCADLYAMGRSLGIWMMLIGQDLDPIASHPVASNIFQNTATYFTGYLRDNSAITSMSARGIPAELLVQNTMDSFFLDSKEGARRWLISQGNRHFFGDLYPSFASVGLTMNGESNEFKHGRALDCSEIRASYFEQFSNKYQACSELAKHLERQSIDRQVV